MNIKRYNSTIPPVSSRILFSSLSRLVNRIYDCLVHLENSQYALELFIQKNCHSFQSPYDDLFYNFCCTVDDCRVILEDIKSNYKDNKELFINEKK